jgi:DNA-binding transcriptional MerR regulator
MKIGEFAKQFDINKETVRFYAQKKLLNPIKTRYYYDYEENCVADMATILKLKTLGFSLDDISRYLTFFRNATRHMITEKDALIRFIDQKIESVDSRMAQLQQNKQILSKIRSKITAHYNRTVDDDAWGIPLDFLSRLICPKCGRGLQVENGEIVKNSLVKGDLLCACGYHAEIKEGIIVFDGVDYGSVSAEKLSIMKREDFSPPEYSAAISASVNWVIQQLLKQPLKGKVILDPMTQGGIRSVQMIERLTDCCTDFIYLAMDIHFEQVYHFKQLLSTLERKPRFVFFSGDYEHLPIRFESCDYIASFLGLQTYLHYKGLFPHEKLLTFLKGGGKWFETLFYVTDKKMILNEYKDMGPFLNQGFLKDTLSEIMKCRFVDSGGTSQTGELGQFLNSDAELNFFSFMGTK